MTAMRDCRILMLPLLLLLMCSSEGILAGKAIAATQPDLLSDEISEDGEGLAQGIADPLEPINRAVFVFNDKLYFWVLKPVKTGYSAVLPKDIRVCLGNFVSNLATPVALINSLLQGRWEDAGVTLSRFGINTVLGVYGFADPAASEFGLNPRAADFGQTLGVYGAGGGVFLYWPLLGPSNIRDSIGLFADNLAQPINYLGLNSSEKLNYAGGSYVNRLSLSSDAYEEMKKYSVDPYVSTREAYQEYRNARIKWNRQQQDNTKSPTGTDILPGVDQEIFPDIDKKL
jgi:phospholipid-binding lipoprotein MlaA